MKKNNAYQYIFVVLTYRNGKDLPDLALSLQKYIQDYKVIVVNSFYDNKSEKAIEELASNFNFDFISVPNKGYGYGNNKGIEYAINNFDFKYLIVCNSDILIKKFDSKSLPCGPAIIGPEIITLSGKHQNPYWYIKNQPTEFLIYKSFKKDRRVLRVFSQAVNRLIREYFLRFKKKNAISQVYALHGSFLIFTAEALKILKEPFDSNMFLYYEEAYLSYKARMNNIPMFYDSKIKILHKEDGSTSGTSFDGREYAKASFIYYYENKNLYDE